MTVLVKFQIEIGFIHWIAWEFKIVDDVMSTIISFFFFFFFGFDVMWKRPITAYTLILLVIWELFQSSETWKISSAYAKRTRGPNGKIVLDYQRLMDSSR